MAIDVLRTVSALRDWRATQAGEHKRVALVPTMGALHDGHLELVREGLRRADSIVTSIFVNPTQFAPHEDFSKYPRTWDADLEKLESVGGQAVFYPTPEEMYKPGFATTVSVSGITDDLEGQFRPGHFAGVATVVAKLLLQAQAEIALFGEKDFQQLAVIRRLAADLDIPGEIVGVPIVRDTDGLALSSRNTYLNKDQRNVAGQLNKILFNFAARAETGAAFAELEEEGRSALLNAKFDAVDYLTFRDADSLASPGDETKAVRLLAVARLGATRLLDNVAVRSPSLLRHKVGI